MESPFWADKKPIKYRTGPCTAGFVALSRAFEQEDGKKLYQCTARFEGEEAAKMVALLDELCALDQKVRKKKTQPPYTWEEDEETGEKTGALIVRFKANAGGVVKQGKRAGQTWEHRIIIRQPKGQEGDIGTGSKLELLFTVRPTEFGKRNYLQLQPVAVKVLELVRYVGGGFDDEGFFDDAEGFDEVRPSFAASEAGGDSGPASSGGVSRAAVDGDDDDDEDEEF